MSDHHEHPHDEHHQSHEAEHAHGHVNDQGMRGAFRYLRLAPHMWRSEINNAVVAIVDPKHGEHVVDIGAGMGAGTMVAARSRASVTAVEPTPFLRRVLAARRWFQRNRSSITVADGSAEHLPAQDSTIDAMWAVNTMHHWIDTERGATEIARALRPGGRVVLVDEDFLDPAHPEFERFGSRHDGEGHSHGFTMVDAERMGALLTQAGLVDVDAQRRTIVGRPGTVVTGQSPAAR